MVIGQANDTAVTKPPVVGFILEQTLGHVTHADNLRRLVPLSGVVDARFADVNYPVSGWSARVPLFHSNWTVRAGIRARRIIHRLLRNDHVEALFIHTQVPATLAGRLLTRVPTVVSLDATPIQYDELGAHYAHERSSERIERIKWRLHRRSFAKAAHIVSWSEWGKRGLVDRYDVPADKITVIAPGVNLAQWARDGADGRVLQPDEPVRVLFVGGDLIRKGGAQLIAAFAEVRARLASATPPRRAELHLVTNAVVSIPEGVFLHPALAPNSPELIEQYHRAHIFCLPTLGDCLPMVLSEAAASELALVSTDVGAIGEIVRDGETGVLVPPGDVDRLADALFGLIIDDARRTRLARAAKALVTRDFDAAANAAQLARLLSGLAESRRVTATSGRKAVLTVSGRIPGNLAEEVAAGRRPRADYAVLAEALNADLLDYAAAERIGGAFGRMLARLGTHEIGLALACFRERRRLDLVVTDGEQIGLPYAALARLVRRKRLPRHAMIVHVMSVPKKVTLFRRLGLRRRIDQMLVYATRQREFAIDELGMRADDVNLTPFMVDTRFFDVTQVDVPQRRLVASAGLEFRDYETLVDAVRDLDVEVVIAAASPWSKRSATVSTHPLPPNVTATKLGFEDLRRLYAESLFVVMPLQPVEFQAGITTILEAMSMSRPVIVSSTAGQTDTIEHEGNGLCVPPGDVRMLRQAIVRLLADEALRLRLGEAARAWAVAHADVSVYADGIVALTARTSRADSAPRGAGLPTS